MPAPPLDTPRLLLRAHRHEDFAEIVEMWADPAVTRFIGGRPFTAEESWQKLLRQVGHWELLGFGYWVVRERSSGRFVGEVGFADLRRELEPPLGDAPEMGWVLAPWSHGRGYATEAVLAALGWGAKAWGPRRTVCIIDPRNDASLRVAARADFREFARTTYHGDATVLLERQG